MQVQSIQNTDTISTATNTVSETDCDFSSYLNTSKSLDDIFKEASETYGVSIDLLKAIAKAESNFDPTATSHCGAQGVMQLMPATAKSLGVTDAYDPYQNIMGGAKYISQMLKKYDGNIPLALAAYNAGPGNVAKYGGIPPFEETQNYVVKVTRYMNEGVNAPEQSFFVSSGLQKNVSDATPFTSIPATDTYYETILDEIFSYDDYLKFLEMYLEAENAQQLQEKKKQEEMEQSKSHYSFQEIKYNPAVLHLMGDNSIV